MLQALRHPNVVGYRKAYIQDGKLNIVLDFADNYDLAHHIAAAKARKTPFDEETILYWFSQIASALHYVHSRNIMHRDLKTQNIFLTRENIIKLGDFGIAKVMDECKAWRERERNR